MKALLGMTLACAACCALPLVSAGLVGAGAAGFMLSLWQWELWAAIIAIAAAGGAALWYRRRRAGALCRVGNGPSRSG